MLSAILLADNLESPVDDKDLLTEVRVEVRYIKEEISNLRKWLQIGLEKQEFEKTVDKIEEKFAEHSADINNLKNFRYWILGAGAAVGIITHLFLDIIINKHP
jgi:hypothetical protein